MDSDNQLKLRIDEALDSSGYHSLRRVDVHVKNNVVVLSGRIESWYMKQVAQEVVMGITGKGCVQNELVVASDSK